MKQRLFVVGVNSALKPSLAFIDGNLQASSKLLMLGNVCLSTSEDLSNVQSHTFWLLLTSTVDFHLHFCARRWLRLQKLLPTDSIFLPFLVFPVTFIVTEVRLLSAVNSHLSCLCGALLRAIPHLITRPVTRWAQGGESPWKNVLDVI